MFIGNVRCARVGVHGIACGGVLEMLDLGIGRRCRRVPIDQPLSPLLLCVCLFLRKLHV